MTDPEQMKRRLDDGRAMIDKATEQGRDVQAWEEFWMLLLKEYEDICDSIGHGQAATNKKEGQR